MRKLFLAATIMILVSGLAAAQPPTPGSMEDSTSSDDSIPVPDDSINQNFSDNTSDANSTETGEANLGNDSGGFIGGIISFFSGIF